MIHGWRPVANRGGPLARVEIIITLVVSVSVHRATAAELLSWDETETRRVLSFGPWPQPVSRDPSNRVSGKPEAIALGERLFFNPRLSDSGNLACASCHAPARNWTDGRSRALGNAIGDRNTLALENVGLQHWFGWDGGNDNLWAQSIRPLLDAREMGAGTARAAAALRNDPELAVLYARAFGARPRAGNEKLLVDIGKALAAFQETLISARTPFDVFRDALAGGDLSVAARYPAAAQRGLKLFFGSGNCAVCHAGPAFSNGEFHDIGIAYFIDGARVDSGRHGGISRLLASRFNRLGRYSDERSRAAATGTRHVRQQPRNFGEFRTPGLRNVALTAPYMHNGSLATLCDVVNHYSELKEERLHADGERILKPLRLTPAEKGDLLAFLVSLTSHGKDAPPTTTAVCAA